MAPSGPRLRSLGFTQRRFEVYNVVSCHRVDVIGDPGAKDPNELTRTQAERLMAKRGKDTAANDIDVVLDVVMTNARGDDEQLWALHQAFVDHVQLPADAFIVGEPIEVLQIEYDGNERRGLTARCRREDGSEHTAALADVMFPGGPSGATYAAAYRKWIGVEPIPVEPSKSTRRKNRHKATPDDLDLGGPIDLIVISVKERTARCRVPESDRVITLRASRLWDVVPGQIVTISPRKQWRYSGHPYLSGEIESMSIDAGALGLVPLKLEDVGMWDPKEHYWGEDDEPIEPWAKPIIARGPRPGFEMEQVLPGEDIDDPFEDPITRSNTLKHGGDHIEAEKLLMELCESDLRCLDAHAHLGNLVFDHRPEDAIRHYEVGLRIGELSLGHDFDGVLLWGHIDNRPFLRCMHGYGLCLWRMARFDDAGSVFDRMLWLNPSDNQGVRFLIDEVRAGAAWEDRENE